MPEPSVRAVQVKVRSWVREGCDGRRRGILRAEGGSMPGGVMG